VPLSPVTGRYVPVEVLGDIYDVFFLEAGQGIPLVCQHTAGAHNHQWRNLLRSQEVTESFRVIAYDLPFHGKSDPPADKRWWEQEYRLTKEFFCEFVVAFSEALNLELPVFMGCSMGGAVCLQLAQDYSEHFRAFIALEAAEYMPGQYSDWWVHPGVDNGSLSASMAAGLIAPQASERERRLTMWYDGQAAPGVTNGDLYFYSVEHDLRDSAAEIDARNTPLYLLTGEYDYLSTPAETAEMAAKIPGAKAVAMPGLGHYPMSEDHDAFMTHLRPILAEIEAASGSAAPPPAPSNAA
jgi:pimeloyl-ACP methyl ester carboxylesterase